ncbi:Hypothetical protein DEACI_0981 [Acididesulfobacillus acetoxydans]|uniref:Small acid-soluble spore protein, alpha/beta-type, conserved site n=1 Tax=Acididesulfobacillus acetoxydans TaxID=1561005 RepID=A0A8S0W237_9FIRM|nr:hypothetical protein [Acididesulfobacillus acetoxydans]CAA7600328.1 Hypothetical protein DEACI_0981 [Acididesulfobacillus acetoxydans]CEJ06104.1 Small acid-soluble spore protein, alpha/beta-type, conserved site [Acididesulfobacillus acetoxydans]
MIVANRIPYTPVFISYQESHFYLAVNAQGCLLYSVEDPHPLYRLNEPILLAVGSAGNAQTVHLAVLKANGELCYTVVPKSGTPQTTVLTKLDVRSTKYRRLILMPRGELVHIFYAYSHQSVPDLWYIEHRLWNGKAWQSVRLGEVVHPRHPLYHIGLDSQQNIHFLALTFQGRQSILLQNRFHGAFHLWGNPVQALTLQNEVVDMASALTPDNTQHIFWVTKSPGENFEVHWAKRPQAQEIGGSWVSAPAPIHTVGGPWQGCGALELNGTLWLLLKGEQEYLLSNAGGTWRLAATRPAAHRPLEYVRRDGRSFYHSSWLLQDSSVKVPLFYEELGLRLAQPAPGPHEVTRRALQPGVSAAPLPPVSPSAVQAAVRSGEPPADRSPVPDRETKMLAEEVSRVADGQERAEENLVQIRAEIKSMEATVETKIQEIRSAARENAQDIRLAAGTEIRQAAADEAEKTRRAAAAESEELRRALAAEAEKTRQASAASLDEIRRANAAEIEQLRQAIAEEAEKARLSSVTESEEFSRNLAAEGEKMRQSFAGGLDAIRRANAAEIEKLRQSLAAETEKIHQAAMGGIETIRQVLQEELQNFRLETVQQLQEIRLDTGRRVEEIRLMTHEVEQMVACQMADISQAQLRVADAQIQVADAHEKGFWKRWFR